MLKKRELFNRRINMGLTIHYNISFKGSADQLLSKLQTIRNQCLDLPFEEVDEIEHLHYGKKEFQCYQDIEQRTRYPNNTPERMEKAQNLYKAMGIDREIMINYDVYHRQKRFSPVEAVKWGLWAGQGCEGSNFNFFKKKTWWKCHSFTKTQYAEQFVRCHLLVIKILDLFKEQGFTVQVNDEGNYWKTRDLKVLAKEINDYTTLLKTVFGNISKQAEQAGMIVEAPITECENYMKTD